jgi:hypothetical protein
MNDELKNLSLIHHSKEGRQQQKQGRHRRRGARRRLLARGVRLRPAAPAGRAHHCQPEDSGCRSRRRHDARHAGHHAGRTFSALGLKGINIIAIAQGSSEYNVSFVVEAAAMRDAVLAVHNEFGLRRRASRFESPEGALSGS